MVNGSGGFRLNQPDLDPTQSIGAKEKVSLPSRGDE